MDDRFWVEDIRDHARYALAYSAHDDHAHLLATVKALENLFEASTALSEPTREAIFPAADHAALRRLRNFWVHQYHRIDAALVHAVVADEMPAILERAEAWLDA